MHKVGLAKLMLIENKINNKARFRHRDINVIVTQSKRVNPIPPPKLPGPKSWKRNKIAHDPVQMHIF
jgi:hypothetical protein